MKGRQPNITRFKHYKFEEDVINYIYNGGRELGIKLDLHRPHVSYYQRKLSPIKST